MATTSTPNTLLFEVTKVPLQGKNLIEASAGTGKTYSLAIMALRFVVEQGMPLRQIVMVTFTEKAVAELQMRVRLFIQEAHAYSCTPNLSTDPTIKTIVDQQANAREHLVEALRELDELNIYTIHSFCQQTLSEFAFQTGESFNRELLPDLSLYLERFVHAFMREHLYHLTAAELSEVLNTCKLILDPALYLTALRESKLSKIQCYDELIAYYRTNFNNPTLESRIEELANNPSAKYVYDLFHALSIDERLDALLIQANVFSFDDLILNLRKNITPELIACLADKYRVLFIDEFQDTDAMQYELFRKLFVDQTVFFIGDPKQSIYKFRNADINSYFKSKQQVDTIYTLPINYRSTATMVEAVNELFDDNRFTGDSNAFLFSKNKALIQHQTIQAHNKEKDYLTYNGTIVPTALYINPYLNENEIADNIQSFLAHAHHKGQAILPNQIAFIARKNDDLHAMKKALAERKIPAVIIQEQLIFETEEAYFILRLLRTIQTRSVRDIRLVLSHRLFNIQISILDKLEFNTYINQFFNYSNALQVKGVYNVLMQIYADFNLQNNIQQNIKNEIQFWANITQITEQLQHLQTQDRLTLEELIVKLEKRSFTDDNVYQTRIESDEKAIQLLTIHKAKGLEFDYIFTSNLNWGKSTSITGFFKYYDTTTEQYHSDLSLNNIGYYNNVYQLSEDQEKRRALYVLLTRAKYGIFCYAKATKGKGFFDLFTQNHSSVNVGAVFNFIPANTSYQLQKRTNTSLPVVALKIADKDWKKLSYSYFSGPYNPYLTHDSDVSHTDYDAFIFEQLAKGITTGNLVHEILERINFAQDTYWKPWIKHCITRFAPTKTAAYDVYLPQLIQHLVETKIPLNEAEIQLCRIGNAQKITELEFDFHVNHLKLDCLNQLTNANVELPLLTSESYYGVFNGLIDLVFEHEGKYYIVDWKTNYLGNQLEDYTFDKVQVAMTHHNYHLQYCIYSIALVQYLESKLPNFDYETHFGGVIYLFVRGIRKNSLTGIYTNRLSQHDITLLKQVFQ